MRTRSLKSQFHKLRRRAEKETEVSDEAVLRWDGSQSRLPAELEKKQGAALVFREIKLQRNPNVVDLGRILMLFHLRLKLAADSVNKWRRERVCGHGFYFSPTEDDRLARLRRGFFFTSVRCAIFSIVPRRMYSWRIFSSISSRRSYSRFGFLRGPRPSA